MMGGSAPGIAQSATSKVWASAQNIVATMKYVTDVYANIQTNLGNHDYKLDTYTCQTWVTNRLALQNDNFTR